jgi:hypothetical protein
MTGTVDEFRIYSAALTDAEVLDSFNAGPDAEISVEPAAPAPKVVWVSEWNADANGVVYDQGWIDLLEAEGYDVDANTAGNFIDFTESKIAELEAADIIIISRNSNSGNYAGDVNEVTQWNSFTTPIIMLTPWIARSNRWEWINSTTIEEYYPETFMDVVAVDHPVFEGITTEAIDTLNIVDVIDETVDSGQNSFIITTDVGNGTLLARRMDDGSIWIAEWEAGVVCYEGAIQVPAGKRMLFTAGGGGGQTAGSMNLNADGQKMFLNAVKYMLPVKPVDPGTDNLVAYYPLDGDVLDASGNGLDGTIMGDPNFVEGIIGMGLKLDGVDDYVDCGNNPLFDFTEQITLATWVNVNDFGNGQNDPWVNKGDHSWCIKGHRTGYAIEFFVYEGTWNWISAEVGDLNNQWHHVAGTFDGTQLKIYVDSAEVATKDYVGGIATSVHNVAIGTNTEAAGRFSEGILDEVRIYNKALSAEEILYIAQ